MKQLSSAPGHRSRKPRGEEKRNHVDVNQPEDALMESSQQCTGSGTQPAASVTLYNILLCEEEPGEVPVLQNTRTFEADPAGQNPECSQCSWCPPEVAAICGKRFHGDCRRSGVF